MTMTEPLTKERLEAMLELLSDRLTMIYDALKMQLSESDPDGLKELEYVHDTLGIPLSEWDGVMPTEEDENVLDGHRDLGFGG